MSRHTLALLRQAVHLEVALRRNAEGVGDTVEEREHCGDVYGLGDLRLRPTRVAKLLNLFGRCARCRFGHFLNVIEQEALCDAKSGVVEVTFGDGCYCLVLCSLDTQEVGMRVQSIRAPV